jgi:hypothetical protein
MAFQLQLPRVTPDGPLHGGDDLTPT